MKLLHIKPLAKRLDCTLSVPGSKSLSNRALLLAAVAEGESILDHIPDSDDIQAALSALRGLGVPVLNPSAGRYVVHGHGLAFPVRSGELDIRSSGTVGRFLTGLLAAAPAGSWRVAATDQLARRPIGPLLDALGAWGADIRRENAERSFPLLVNGTGLSGGAVAISAAKSSQFASGILLAAPLSSRPSVVAITDIDPEECYIDLTLDLMHSFGVRTETEKAPGTQTVFINPQPYRACSLVMEADFNSANYFLALPLLVGGCVTVANLSAHSGQPGAKFISVLERLGGMIENAGGGVSVSGTGETLRGGFTLDMRAMSEMALTLGVLAVFADGPVTMTNIAHIRGHETDRIDALVKQLARLGVHCDEGSDWVTIHPLPRSSIASCVVDSCGDHRIAMSLAILGLAANGLSITNPDAVGKTFPGFFDCLSVAGAVVS